MRPRFASKPSAQSLRRAHLLKASVLLGLCTLVACSGDGPSGPADGDKPVFIAGGQSGDGDVVGSGGAGASDAASGGSTTGGNPSIGTGGEATGGSVALPPDCSGIASAGFELCESTSDSCGAVFSEGEGCSAVCAAAGLTCTSAYENVEGVCERDMALPALPCDSGHQSDYCLCQGENQVGSGGSDPGTGGSNTGGAGSDGSGGSSSADDPKFPAPGATGVCSDPSIRLRFESPPSLGSSGSLRVYDAANATSPVVTINMGTNEITDTVGGQSFKQPRPAYVHRKEAIFVLPAKGLSYGKTYYVTMDSGVVAGVSAITDTNAWRFTTASAAPANKSALRVAADGTGQYCTLQGAIDAAATGSKITVASGAYFGITYFKEKNGLSIVGESRASTIITGVNNNNLNPSTRGRALVGLENVSDLLIENVTIENLTPQGGSQAEALAMLSCDKCIVRNTTVRSLQDTLLWSGRIYAEDCLIEGNVDYIWGSGAVYFKRCEIKTVGRKGYNLQARNGSGYGYVFVDSKLTAEPGITGDVLARIDVTQYPQSHVAYINCEMGSHISAAGWAITGGGSTAQLRFWEYQSKTPGGAFVNTGSRASGSRQISSGEAAQMRDPTVVLSGWNPAP